MKKYKNVGKRFILSLAVKIYKKWTAFIKFPCISRLIVQKIMLWKNHIKEGIKMARQVDPNAKMALNNYKMEIANELGINNPTAPTSVIDSSGNMSMTKRMVKAGEGRFSRKNK